MKTNSSNSSVDFTEVYELLLETFNPVPTLVVMPCDMETPYRWLKDSAANLALQIPMDSVENMKTAIRTAANHIEVSEVCEFDKLLFSKRSADLYKTALEISKFLSIGCPLVFIGTEEYLDGSNGYCIKVHNKLRS